MHNKKNSFSYKLRGILIFLAFTAILSIARSQTPGYYIDISKKYLRNQEYVQALQFLNQAIQIVPLTPELYLLRGFTKYSLDDYYGAEQDYTISLSIFPYNPDVLINRAIVRTQQQNYPGALEDLSSAAKIDTTSSEIYFYLARIKLILKKYYACINDCNKALQLKSPNENIYILRGSSEMGLERFDLAMADFRKAMELNPSNTYSYLQAGTMYMDHNKPDSAISFFDEAIKVDSINNYALFSRSLARVKLNDRDGAIQDLDKVIRLSPYNSYAYFNRAILYNEKKDWKSAIRDFDYVIRLNPKNLVSYYYRGLLKSGIKDYRGAIADFDKALELLPEYPDGYYARSMAKRKINDPTAAKDYKMAYDLARKNHLSTDSMSTKKKDFLQSLIKLSGDFEEMNTINGKIQNQSVDIHLLPMYRVFIGKTGFDKVEFYDSYGKKNYPQHIITLTRDPAVITDSLCRSEIVYLTRQIDSVAGLPDNYFRRAASYSGIKKYNLAFADFDTCLRKDSCFILAFFSRAIARYDLIQLINSLNDYQPEISINQNKNDLREQTRSHKMEYTYEMVIQDLDKAIHLDPGFSFAYYNRGFVYCNMGEYHKAENDFSSALKIRENFPEAYFNRGLVRILLNDIPEACEDLSHAGELGIVDAYKVMKRYCFKQ